MYNLTRPLFITDQIEKAFQDYATSQYPKEACAFVYQDALMIVENVHPEPTTSFALSAAGNQFMSKAQAFLHSHPDGDMTPSDHDMRTQIACGIPFGVCLTKAEGSERITWWGDHLINYPLLDRPFTHGAFDCYSLLRSVYAQERGIILPNFPREDNWWRGGRDVISEHVEESGFSVFTGDPEKYDVYIMQFSSATPPSHIAINYGDGTIIHHLDGGLSKVDYAVRYAKFINKVYRYNG